MNRKPKHPIPSQCEVERFLDVYGVQLQLLRAGGGTGASVAFERARLRLFQRERARKS